MVVVFKCLATGCRFFSFVEAKQQCYLKYDYGTYNASVSGVVVSGPDYCDDEHGKTKRRKPCSSGYGGDSCPKGHEFESQHRILDGHFFSYVFAVKFVMCA